MQNIWKPQEKAFSDAIEYMKKRKSGEIKSILTPWTKFNDAGVDGLEWNSTIVIGARPATGKTLIKDQIIREAFNLNAQDFRVLEFQFEMIGRVSALRNFSSFLHRSYKYLCSAEGQISEQDLRKCEDYSKIMCNYPIDIVDKPKTVKELRHTVGLYMESYSVKLPNGERKYTPTIVTLDHSILVKRDADEKSTLDMLYNLGEALTELKRKYPIIFIILSQLNRDVEKIERNEPGRNSNYLVTSDLFGSDALLQHADILVLVDRPGKRNLREYGAEKFIIDDDDLLAFHFLKVRNGDTRMSFFKGDYPNMKVVETLTPICKKPKLTSPSSSSMKSSQSSSLPPLPTLSIEEFDNENQ
jgi:replicative DNA helicase